MRNWLGQDIQPGMYVYRGARGGNHSSFKIGQVEKLNSGKGTVKVRWLVEPSGVFTKDRGWVNSVRYMGSMGNPSINTLVSVDEETVVFLVAIAEETNRLRRQAMQGGFYDFPLTEEKFKEHINTYAQQELGRKDGYYE